MNRIGSSYTKMNVLMIYHTLILKIVWRN